MRAHSILAGAMVTMLLTAPAAAAQPISSSSSVVQELNQAVSASTTLSTGVPMILYCGFTYSCGGI
ncbi:MAG: hypothetical protein GX898_08690 [Corynebacterium sp.]|nr:hypothetical protein [Corynebacterium sp.]